MSRFGPLSLTVALLSLPLGGCQDGVWPDGSLEYVEESYCEDACTDLALLSREHGHHAGREQWFLFVWAETPTVWWVRHFYGVAPGDPPFDLRWSAFRWAEGPPTFRFFEHPPSYEEIREIWGIPAGPQNEDCGDVFHDEWIRVVGEGPEFDFEPSCD